ncbi:unnamed protein product [Boreogadus saida]
MKAYTHTFIILGKESGQLDPAYRMHPQRPSSAERPGFGVRHSREERLGGIHMSIIRVSDIRGVLHAERAAQDLALIRGSITFGHVPTQRNQERRVRKRKK